MLLGAGLVSIGTRKRNKATEGRQKDKGKQLERGTGAERRKQML